MTAAVIAGVTLPAITADARRASLPKTGAASYAYTAQAPNRILDTRSSGQRLAGGTSLNLTVAGGTTTVPVAATAVVLNVTVTGTTGAGFLTVWPAGLGQPTASNLNWAAGDTRPNLVTVPVGTGGQVSIYSNSPTDVVVDEEGYYSTPVSTAGGYVAVPPARITDTRAGSGQANAGSTLAAGSTLSVQVTGAGGVPSSGVSGVVVNATVTNTTAASFLTAWAAGGTMPVVSNLNGVAGWTVPNRITVPVGTGGKVNFYNKFGSVDLIVDVDGYYTDATASGKFFVPQTPARVIDTRIQGGTLGAGASSTYQVTGFAGVPATGATAVLFNTTVTNTTAPSFLTVYPGPTRPTASDLNWVAGQTIPNMVVATLSSTGSVTFYNNTGSTDLVVDLFGFFGTAGGTSVTATKSSLPADSASQSTLTATVTDSSGAAVALDPVSWNTSGSPAAACGTLSAAAGTTNGAGQTTTIYTASATPGTCTITATEAVHATSGTVVITQTALTNKITFAPTAATILANGSSTQVFVTTTTNPVSGGVGAGDTLTFTLSASGTGSCGTLDKTTGTTDAASTVTITYTSSATIGFCTIKATESATSGTGSAIVTQKSPAAPGNSTVETLAAASVPADGKTTDVVTVQVTGPANAVDQVMFTMVAGTAGSCGTLSSSLGTTDTSGKLTTTYTASTTAGTCAITATEANGGSSNAKTITQTPVANTVVVVASPKNVPATVTSTSGVTVTVTNGLSGAAVAGDDLTFLLTADPATPGACGGLTSISGTPAGRTNASGQVTATYTATAVTGFCTIKATDTSTTGGTGSTTIVQTNPASAGLVTTVALSKSSIQADGTSTSVATATVKSGAGTAVQSDHIQFTTSPSTTGACGALTPAATVANRTTDVNGQVAVTYTSTTTVGTCTITATESFSASSGSAALTQTAVTNTVVVGAVSPQAIGAAATALTATVTNVTAPGGVVASDAVAFTLSASPAGACGTLGSSSATTNSSGVASTTYTPSTTIGFCKITATESAGGQSASKTVTQTNSPASANTVAVSATPLSVPADGATTSAVTATVAGAAAIGDPVIFTLTPSAAGSCGTISAVSNGGNTNASGVVTATYTASTTVGTCVITATEASGGASSPTAAANTITQTQVPYTVTFTASPPTVSTSAAGTSILTVTVTDTNTGAPISGDVVTFPTLTPSPAGACGAITGSTSPTNAAGVVTATYTASGVIGSCTITAHEAGTGVNKTTTITQTA
jgi:hypothetical protein